MHEQYPGVVPNVDVGPTDPMLRDLLDRKLDLVIARGRPSVALQGSTEDLNAERLFNDDIVVAASAHSKWARRRKIDLAELKNEQWILSAPGSWNHTIAAEAFRARGLDMPKVSLTTLSIHLRANLVVSGPFITVFPQSVLRLYGHRFSLKALKVDLPRRPWPVTIITLKHRTLSPIVERFILCAREVATSFAPAPSHR
jgi:DNA-binding transcriptional LysR family regulator